MATSQESMKQQPVRYAVVGAGWIAQAAVLPSFVNANRSKVVALVSRDPAKRAALAERHQIPFAGGYEQFEDILRDAAVNAVYIALPNSMHREFAERAARARVHVLCEKPMAVTEEDCQAMIDAAENAGVKLMVGYRLHFDPANLTAIQAAASGSLGELRYFESALSQITEEGIRLDPALGGGALYDAGVYCVNAARYLFRDEPIEVFGMESSPDERFEGVDETTSALLRFPNGRLACFTCSLGAAKTSSFRLVGTKGAIVADPAFAFDAPLSETWTSNGGEQTVTFPVSDQFSAEIDAFSSCIIEGRDPQPSGQEGLADVRVMAAIKRSVVAGRSIRMDEFEVPARPSLEQAMHRPPVPQPELIHASAGSK